MRNLILLCALFFSSLWYVNAQGQVDICALHSSQVKYDGNMSDDVKLSMEIPMDEVKDAFNDFVKEKFDSDLKGYGFLARKDEVTTELMEAPLLADQAIQLIGSFKENGASTDLYLLARWEDESYVRENIDHDTYDRLKEVGNDFLQYYVPGYYQEQLEKATENYEDAVDAFSS